MAAKTLTEHADAAGGAVVSAVAMTAKRDPWNAIVMAAGAVAIVIALVWNVRENTKTIHEALSTRPTKAEVLAENKAQDERVRDAFAKYLAHPHPNAATRAEFEQVIQGVNSRLDALGADVRSLSSRIDRLLERDK